MSTAEEKKINHLTPQSVLSICRYQFNKGLVPVDAQPYALISSSHCVRLLLPHIGALQSSQGLLLRSSLFLRYGPLEPCLKSSAIPFVLGRLYRSAIFAPISWTHQRSAPIGPDVSSGCLIKDPAAPTCTARRCWVFCFSLLGFLHCSLLCSAPLSLISSTNVLFFQASQSLRHEYKRRIKTG